METINSAQCRDKTLRILPEIDYDKEISFLQCCKFPVAFFRNINSSAVRNLLTDNFKISDSLQIDFLYKKIVFVQLC